MPLYRHKKVECPVVLVRLAPWFHTRIPDGWMSVHNQLVWRKHQGAACFWHHTRDYSIIIIQSMFGEAFFCVSLVGYWTWKGSFGIEINPSFGVEGSVTWMPVPKMTWTISLPPLRHVPLHSPRRLAAASAVAFLCRRPDILRERQKLLWVLDESMFTILLFHDVSWMNWFLTVVDSQDGYLCIYLYLCTSIHLCTFIIYNTIYIQMREMLVFYTYIYIYICCDCV